MPTSLWFIIPAYQRYALARICLGHLATVCEQMTDVGVDTSACVIADDDNLSLARDLGFATVRCDNSSLGRKINEGFRFAHDDGVEFVIPLGSDDLVCAEVFLPNLPEDGKVSVFRRSAVVREDGGELARLFVSYAGGDGVRIYPLEVMACVDYQPADEDRMRGIDTSIKHNIETVQGRRLDFVYCESDPLQLVDIKSTGLARQLNPYKGCADMYGESRSSDPLGELARFYPQSVIEGLARYFEMVPA